ncbi:Enzyme of dihydrofolate reductase family protein [Planococcus antarcticus DSM 14505]|uniref:Enzyme of dihydrofolate reductase family protein n=1 Tax=Planococcus antarcticus DSM 14505 TaxID=1185653 RepID=A0AA87LT46_9BACL|nr:dihydrofolate reductase family protein [Planococcus antarcticus]EIM08548.1 Enzyme of dihydrofolate reductase family protein [Planococcus antarcticus DSM 14505]
MEAERKIICYIAASLDGYIATEDDSLEWLFEVEGESDAGYAEFLKTIDVVVMGRRTYDWVMEAENGKFPHQDMTRYVFTSSGVEENEFVKFMDQDIASFAKALKANPGKDIWVIGGSNLLHGFVKENLIDEWIISIAPVLIGKGIPLFQELDFKTHLKLNSVKSYGQFAQLHYERK